MKDIPDQIAMAGDWHGDPTFAIEAIDYAAKRGAQVILHTGDYGWIYTTRFVRVVEEQLEENDLYLFFADGNHEQHDKLDHLVRSDTILPGMHMAPERERMHMPRPGKISPRVWHLARGTRWEWGGLRFLACGGGHSVDRKRRVPHRSWWPQEWITDAQLDTCVKGGRADILLAHDCPASVDIPGLAETALLFDADEIIMSEKHRERLDWMCRRVQPSMIVHGHYHTAYMRDADLGYGPVAVLGLSDNTTGSLRGNITVFSLEELRQHTGKTLNV